MNLISNKLNKNLFKTAIVLAIIAFFVYVVHFLERKPATLEIKTGTVTIYAQVADTDHKRSMGLSYTEKMDSNSGMLFIFDEANIHSFWMRDMFFNIDIIWLDESKQVIGFFENVSKDSYNQKKPDQSKIYKSPENTKYVLELNEGSIEKFKIKVGDKLDFKY